MGRYINRLPLRWLLTLLQANGFVFGVDTIISLNRYWITVGGREKITKEKLKYQLATFFCFAREDQELFYEIFDTYLPDLEPINWDKPLSNEKEDEIITIKKELHQKRPVVKKEISKASKIIEKKIDFTFGPVRPNLIFPDTPINIWNLPNMTPALIPLQEKIWLETREWDIPKSIIATIRSGGIPKVINQQLKQTPKYLVLIEEEGPGDHLAGFSTDLVYEINNRDIEADFFYFKNSPAQCWKSLSKRESYIFLELLQAEWHDARLLLIGKSECFIDPLTGKPTNITLEIAESWKEVALLCTKSPLLWSDNEETLSMLFPLVPLSLDGLSTLMKQWNGIDHKSIAFWQTFYPEPIPPSINTSRDRKQGDIIIELFRFLGKDAFRWLCATTVYPDLFYKLTTQLYNTGIPSQIELSTWEQNEFLNRSLWLISRIDWFRNGYIPESIREKLKEYLDQNDLVHAEREMRKILDWSYNAVPEGSYAAKERDEIFGWLAENIFRIFWFGKDPIKNSQFQKRVEREVGVFFQNISSFREALLYFHEYIDLFIVESSFGDNEELLNLIQEIKIRNIQVPVIIFSNENESYDQSLFFNIGVDEIISDFQELEALIEKKRSSKFLRELVQEEKDSLEIEEITVRQIPIKEIKVAILTPIKVEQKAVQKHLTDIEKKVVGSRFYVFGKFSGVNHEFSVLSARTGSKNAVISLAAHHAIEYFQPDIVLLVGIAGGVKDVKIGDVVVGTKSYGYEAGKEQEGGLVARPEYFTGSKELNAVAMLVDHDESWQKRSDFADDSTKVVFGPIAGGDKVIATSKGIIYAFLKQHYNDTKAVEMEAFGFGETLSHHQDIRWLNIRGISELLDAKSATDSDGNQERAAANAAAFVFELLHLLDASQFAPNSKGKKKNVVVDTDFNVEDNLHIGDIIHINQVIAESNEVRLDKTTASSLQSIKDLMVNDQIKETLERLLIYTKEKDPDLHNDIIAQSGRWNRLKRDKRQGIITSDESQIVHNRIRYSILSIIEDLEG